MLAFVALGAVYLGAGYLFKTLPAGFLPDEDQGIFFGALRLPDGASIQRDEKSAEQLIKGIQNNPGVQDTTTFGGLDFVTTTNNSNVATIFATLKPWDERKTPDTQFAAILARAQGEFFQLKDGFAFGFGLPPILGLGTAGGFDFFLEDRAGGSIADLARTSEELLAAAGKRAGIGQCHQHLSRHRSAVRGHC